MCVPSVTAHSGSSDAEPPTVTVTPVAVAVALTAVFVPCVEDSPTDVPQLTMPMNDGYGMPAPWISRPTSVAANAAVALVTVAEAFVVAPSTTARAGASCTFLSNDRQPFTPNGSVRSHLLSVTRLSLYVVRA